jgi:hypothetical protein
VRHLTPDEFVDAAEGSLASDRQRHVDRCEACRREASALASLMRDAGRAPVPEPSPLFWEQLSTRVSHAVQAEDLPHARSWSAPLRLPALVPLCALATVVVLMVVSVPLGENEMEPSQASSLAFAPAASPAPASSAEREWLAFTEFVGPLDWEAAIAGGLTLNPGDAEVALLELSEDERQELSRLIAGELARLKS